MLLNKRIDITLPGREIGSMEREGALGRLFIINDGVHDGFVVDFFLPAAFFVLHRRVFDI